MNIIDMGLGKIAARRMPGTKKFAAGGDERAKSSSGSG
jgi:hypothetical protein